MKKLLVFGFALFLVVSFTLPAAALENKFGGFFDTSFNYYSSLNYQDDQAAEYSTIRSRTRLYYTAEISKDLKFVNQFEFDTTWGEQASYGDIGADATVFEVKRTYLDFNLADFRFEIGTQGFNLHRGLGFNDDMSGMKVSYRGAGNIIPALWWFRLNDGDRNTGNDGADVDHYTALVNIKAGNMQFVPSVGYLYASNGAFYSAATTTPFAPTSSATTTTGEPMKIYIVGLDFNMKTDIANVEFTGIYEGGQLDDSVDISAYALWGEVGFKLGGAVGLRVAGLYTTGEDATPSGDYDGFWYPEQNSWGRGFSTSELYRKGLEWAKTPYNNGNNVARTDGNAPENRMEFGLGADFKLAKDHKISLDYWNLNFAEDNLTGNSDIGNEIDFKYTWQINKNLQSNYVFAYLIHGDAIKPPTNDASGSYETFLNLRLSF
jgi:hypothetical protein